MASPLGNKTEVTVSPIKSPIVSVRPIIRPMIPVEQTMPVKPTAQSTRESKKSGAVTTNVEHLPTQLTKEQQIAGTVTQFLNKSLVDNSFKAEPSNITLDDILDQGQLGKFLYEIRLKILSILLNHDFLTNSNVEFNNVTAIISPSKQTSVYYIDAIANYIKATYKVDVNIHRCYMKGTTDILPNLNSMNKNPNNMNLVYIKERPPKFNGEIKESPNMMQYVKNINKMKNTIIINDIYPGYAYEKSPWDDRIIKCSLTKKLVSYSLSQYIIQRHVSISEEQYNYLCKVLNGKTDEEIKVIFDKSLFIAVVNGYQITTYDDIIEVLRELKMVKTLENKWSKIGGLKHVVALIKENILDRMNHKDLYTKYGLPQKSGIVLYGPPGTGKTLIAKTLADEAGFHFHYVSSGDILSRYWGEAESRISAIFAEARKNSPSIIFIDEMDSLFEKRVQGSNYAGLNRIVTHFLVLMDGLDSSDDVYIMGATNRISAIDESFLRPGRFDIKIMVGLPDLEDRKEILKIYLSQLQDVKIDVDIDYFAKKTEGFSGADISHLVKSALMPSIQHSIQTGQVILTNDMILDSFNEIHKQLFTRILDTIRPGSIQPQIPDVKWSDIGGLVHTKDIIEKTFINKIKYKELYDKLRIPQKGGLILYGPPGNGKTMLAKALANESGLNFIPIKPSDILTGDHPEGNIKQIFEVAQAAHPCVIFFDEFETMFSKRNILDSKSSIINQLLIEIDGVEKLEGVYLLAATNMIDNVDPAMLRPGRFDLKIYIGYPTPEERANILGIELNKLKENGIDVKIDMHYIVEQTEAFSGADLSYLIKLASSELATAIINREMNTYTLTNIHIDRALNQIKKSKETLI